MINKFIFLLIFSCIVIFGMPYAQQVIQYLVNAHDWIAHALKTVFSDSHVGNALRGLLALLIIPLATGLIPAILYGIVRKRVLPIFMDIVWIVWLLQAGALLAIYKVV